MDIETFCIDLIIKAVGYADSLLYKVHGGCSAYSWYSFIEVKKKIR